jgi:uncharacterized protein YecT (DUF1311 family)
MKLFLLALAMIGSPHASSLEDPRCSGNTTEMIECGAASLKKADEKLNASYLAALKRVEATTVAGEPRKNTRKGLIEAQRLWIQYREKDCGAIRDYANGRLGGAFYLNCMADHAEQRTQELDSYFNE